MNLTESSKVVQYADDTLLFCDDYDIKISLKLSQIDCQNLSLYFTKYSLNFHTKNFELIRFSKNIKAETKIPSSV